jgi:hypothetical protein
MWELLKDPSHADLLVKALEAYLNPNGEKFTFQDWDNILRDYQVGLRSVS